MNDDMFLAKLINMNYDEFFVFSSISKFRNVKEYMERDMPVILDNYYQYMWVECRYNSYTDTMNDILNISNLVSYLKEHREWGVKQCLFYAPNCGGEFKCKADLKHPECDCGVFKHPALLYLEQEGEDEK